MVSVLATGEANVRLDPKRVKPKTIKLVLIAKQASPRSKRLDWWVCSQENMPEWKDMSTHGLLFH
jgi:hypothetical protein